MQIHSLPVVLIVDDTRTNIDVVMDTLGTEYTLCVATDGAEALEVLEHTLPDVILLDVMMPGLSGLEVCQRVRSNPRTFHIPVIFLTARAAPADILKGFSHGAVDYLAKPFDIRELRARVAVHVELKRGRETIARQALTQKQLVHVMCHDMANPLGNIFNAVNLLKEETDTTVMADYLNMIEKAAALGLEVTRSVRSMAALDEKPLELRPVNLRLAVEDSVSLLYHLVEGKSLDVSIDIDPSLTVLAERTPLINSVLNNLLTNAIKFSFPGGKIAYEAGLLRPGDEQQVVLEVRDGGIGIPPVLLSHLFDIGKTTSRTGTVGEQGTGFGMPLMQRFMEAFGGKIGVESRSREEYPSGHGTTLRLFFRQSTHL